MMNGAKRKPAFPLILMILFIHLQIFAVKELLRFVL